MNAVPRPKGLTKVEAAALVFVIGITIVADFFLDTIQNYHLLKVVMLSIAFLTAAKENRFIMNRVFGKEGIANSQDIDTLRGQDGSLLLHLPCDPLLKIFSFISAHDADHLRGVCRALDRFVAENRRRLPFYRSRIEGVVSYRTGRVDFTIDVFSDEFSIEWKEIRLPFVSFQELIAEIQKKWSGVFPRVGSFLVVTELIIIGHYDEEPSVEDLAGVVFFNIPDEECSLSNDDLAALNEVLPPHAQFVFNYLPLSAVSFETNFLLAFAALSSVVSLDYHSDEYDGPTEEEKELLAHLAKTAETLVITDELWDETLPILAGIPRLPCGAMCYFLTTAGIGRLIQKYLSGERSATATLSILGGNARFRPLRSGFTKNEIASAEELSARKNICLLGDEFVFKKRRACIRVTCIDKASSDYLGTQQGNGPRYTFHIVATVGEKK